MNGYYLEWNELPLARVWASTLTEAKTKALKQHSWTGATSISEFSLRYINSTTAFSY